MSDLSTETTAAGLAREIMATWQKAVSAIVETGCRLVAAKEALPHGEWGRMFKGHPEAVSDPIRFSERTAGMLIAVARHPTLSNRKHVSDLPASWGTLYVLSRLPAPDLEAAIREGRVHSEMTREEAKALGAKSGDQSDRAPGQGRRGGAARGHRHQSQQDLGRADDPLPPDVRRMAEDLIRSGHRQLTQRHHPDLGGSVAAMQLVNAAATWLHRQVRLSKEERKNA